MFAAFVSACGLDGGEGGLRDCAGLHPQAGFCGDPVGDGSGDAGGFGVGYGGLRGKPRRGLIRKCRSCGRVRWGFCGRIRCG